MFDLIIRNCDVLKVANGKTWVETSQDICISRNKISAITKSSPESLSAIRQINGSGLLAIPGLMNTHAHVPMVLFRGMVEDVTVTQWFNDYIWPLESNLTKEDVYWGSLLGIAEMIENGVTNVADHYFFMDEVAQAVESSGIRATLCWAVFAHEGETKLDRTCRFVQDWQGKADGRITTYLGPHAPYTCTPEFLALTAKRAHELNTGIHIHVSETQAQVDLSMRLYGITPVRQLEETGILDVPTILGHCRFPTSDDLKLMGNRKTGVAHAPKTYMKLGEAQVVLRQYQEANVPLGLATDGAASSNTLDILEQLRMMVLAQKTAASDATYLNVADALDIAFMGSAKVLHLENELGSVDVGKLADITLIRQDGVSSFPRFNPAANLIYSTKSSDVDTVICNGNILLEGGKLLTIDKEEVKKQISKRIEQLSQRVPGRRIAYYPT